MKLLLALSTFFQALHACTTHFLVPEGDFLYRGTSTDFVMEAKRFDRFHIYERALSEDNWVATVEPDEGDERSYAIHTAEGCCFVLSNDSFRGISVRSGNGAGIGSIMEWWGWFYLPVNSIRAALSKSHTSLSFWTNYSRELATCNEHFDVSVEDVSLHDLHPSYFWKIDSQETTLVDKELLWCFLAYIVDTRWRVPD